MFIAKMFKGLFGGGELDFDMTSLATPPVDTSAKDERDRRRRRLILLKRSKGRRGATLTSPGEGDAPVERATLLGGTA